METSLNGAADQYVANNRNLADTFDIKRPVAERKVSATQPTADKRSSVTRTSSSQGHDQNEAHSKSSAPDVAVNPPEVAPRPAGVVKRHSFSKKGEMPRKSLEGDLDPRVPPVPEESSPTTPTGTEVRYPSGTPSITLSDLKKHRNEERSREGSRENSTIDTAVQNLFLSSLGTNNKKYSSSSLPGRDQAPPGHQHQQHQQQNHKKNGHHNNNTESYPNNAQQPLRRFVAPSNSPVVGGDEKDGCCVIL